MQAPPTHVPAQQSPDWSHASPAERHWQRPAEQSIDPQHSLLERHPPRAAVQQCSASKRIAQTSVPQHCALPVHGAVLSDGMHAADGGWQRPAVHVLPGQQSVLDAQDSPAMRHAHQALVPSDAQAMAPQQPEVPPSPGVHAAPALLQQVRPADPWAQRSPAQQSVAATQPAVPAVRQAVVETQVPAVQRLPVQQSLSSTQLAPVARHAHAPAAQSICPQHSRELAQAPPCRRQHRVATGVGRQS